MRYHQMFLTLYQFSKTGSKECFSKKIKQPFMKQHLWHLNSICQQHFINFQLFPSAQTTCLYYHIPTGSTVTDVFEASPTTMGFSVICQQTYRSPDMQVEQQQPGYPWKKWSSITYSHLQINFMMLMPQVQLIVTACMCQAANSSLLSLSDTFQICSAFVEQ